MKDRMISDVTRLKKSVTQDTYIFLYSLEFDSLNTFISFRATVKHFNYSSKTIMIYARFKKFFKDKYILSLEKLQFTTSSSSNKILFKL